MRRMFTERARGPSAFRSPRLFCSRPFSCIALPGMGMEGGFGVGGGAVMVDDTRHRGPLAIVFFFSLILFPRPFCPLSFLPFNAGNRNSGTFFFLFPLSVVIDVDGRALRISRARPDSTSKFDVREMWWLAVGGRGGWRDTNAGVRGEDFCLIYLDDLCRRASFSHCFRALCAGAEGKAAFPSSSASASAWHRSVNISPAESKHEH